MQANGRAELMLSIFGKKEEEEMIKEKKREKISNFKRKKFKRKFKGQKFIFFSSYPKTWAVLAWSHMGT